MSLKSNFEYIRDWCNHRFLRRDEKVDVDLSNYYTKDEVDVDLSNYYTKDEVDSNISSATPDISVSMYSSSGSKSYSQTIGNNGQFELSRVATSGSYNDLSNKPTIPAAQVQSDWNATSGMGVILNKPTIVQSDWNATSGMGVILNKPTIPAAQVQSDWNATSGMGVILNKPDLSEYMTVEDYQTDEEVVAAALNDLDGRIKAVESKPSVIVSSTDWTTINRNGVTYNSVSAAATAAGITESELEGMVSGELFLPFSFLYGSYRLIFCPMAYANGEIIYQFELDGENITIKLAKHGDSYVLYGHQTLA